MANKRVRFVSPTMYDGVSYAQNQVVELSDADRKALGDSVEAADDTDVEEEARDLASDAPTADIRQDAAMVTHQPGDAQDVPDALRDEQANAEAAKKAKAIESAPKNKAVTSADKK